MFGIFRRKKKDDGPTVSEIEKVISELADKYRYGDVWLYGNYYEGLYEPGDDVQIMLDRSQNPEHIQGFMGECWRTLGLYVDVCLMTEDSPQVRYVLENSRLIHRRKEPGSQNVPEPEKD